MASLEPEVGLPPVWSSFPTLAQGRLSMEIGIDLAIHQPTPEDTLGPRHRRRGGGEIACKNCFCIPLPPPAPALFPPPALAQGRLSLEIGIDLAIHQPTPEDTP